MPYSDNLYSIDSDDEYPDVEPVGGHGAYALPSEEPEQPLGSQTGAQDQDDDPEHALSPADGNFPSHVPGARTQGASSHVPYVPNILVRDPSLEQGTTAESKAREARQERLAADNNLERTTPSTISDHGQSPSRATSPQSSSAYPPTPSTPSRPTHYQPSTAGAYSNNSSSTASHTSSHGPRRSIYSQPTPILPRDAPPAYTPSPTVTSGYTGSTSPTSATALSPVQSDFSRNYSTFSQPSMRRPEESRGLLADPESMGGPSDDDLGNVSPAWRDRVRRRMPYLNWRNCRYAAVCVVLLLVTIGFLVSGITNVKDDLKKDPPKLDPPNSQPILEPPRMDYPAFDGDLPWAESTYCSGNPTERVNIVFPVSYGPGHGFSIVQDVAEHSPPFDTHDVHVSGDVVVRRTGRGTPGPSISLEMLKNDDGINVTADYDRETQSLRVSVPRRLRSDNKVSWPCVSLRMTLWVPGDAVLDYLSVEAVHLAIRLMDNVALNVAQYSKLSTVAGRIVSATDGTTKADKLVEDSAPSYFKFNSRVIDVKSTSADITGYWPLYDLLSLSTISGKIKVRVEPKEEDANSPKPATLYVKGISGNIEVWQPVDAAVSSLSTSGLLGTTSLKTEQYIPPRDYRVNIQTTSGTIKGAIIFSSACRIHSTSGTSTVALLPVLDAAVATNNAAANLETATTSGNVKLQILEPLWYGSDSKTYLPPAPPSPPSLPRLGTLDSAPPAFRCLQSRHASTSATIHLAYPASWEGDFDMGSLSGRIKVHGEGVKIIKAGDGMPGFEVLARKGAGGGSGAQVKSTSGNIDVVVGGMEKS